MWTPNCYLAAYIYRLHKLETSLASDRNKINRFANKMTQQVEVEPHSYSLPLLPILYDLAFFMWRGTLQLTLDY